MATSPIYSWPEPDNTDLVKNGALAIRTLGNAIDTTMGTMVAKTVVDAKGDLIAGTAADTVNRLAVGNNGETLVADSSTSTGLRYQAPVNANPFINAAMQIWQRGTTSADSAGSPYTADRWQMFRSSASGGTTTRQLTGDTTNLPFIQYCARIQRNAGNTNTNVLYFAQTLETINSIPYVGKTVTVSFYARKGADYSGSGSTINANLTYGTGTDQNIATGMTGQTTVISANNLLTTTWQRFTMTGTVATAATQLALYFNYGPTGTAGAADYWEVTGLQLEVGSVATPFKTYAGTIQGELAACQRYYYRQSATQNYSCFGTGNATTTTGAVINVPLPVTLRVEPSAIDYSTLVLTDQTANYSFSTLAGNNQTGKNIASVSLSGLTGLTQFRNYSFVSNGSTSGYIGFSAEL
jgi:hypothetical protein